MFEKIKRWIQQTEIVAQIQRLAAFSISFYLTMDMFVEMVKGDKVKEMVFRGIALFFESSKISILRKSISEKKWSMGVLALAMMTLSIGMASMSATRDVGLATELASNNTAQLEASMAEYIVQRDDWQQRIRDLPAEWKSASLEYQALVDELQIKIDNTRQLILESTTVAVERGGIFEDVARILKIKDGKTLRYTLFVLLIVLVECILFTETWIVARSGQPLYTETEVEEAVRESIKGARKTSAQEELF